MTVGGRQARVMLAAPDRQSLAAQGLTQGTNAGFAPRTPHHTAGNLCHNPPQQTDVHKPGPSFAVGDTASGRGYVRDLQA